MIEFLLILLLLLFVGVFGVVLGVHLQAAKSKTDCGCGRAGKNVDRLILQRLQRLEQRVIVDKSKAEGE